VNYNVKGRESNQGYRIMASIARISWQKSPSFIIIKNGERLMPIVRLAILVDPLFPLLIYFFCSSGHALTHSYPSAAYARERAKYT